MGRDHGYPLLAAPGAKTNHLDESAEGYGRYYPAAVDSYTGSDNVTGAEVVRQRGPIHALLTATHTRSPTSDLLGWPTQPPFEYTLRKGIAEARLAGSTLTALRGLQSAG